MSIFDDVGVPRAFLEAMEKSENEELPKLSHFRVTGLLEPPRIAQLRRIHAREIQIPLTKNLWALLGKGVHKALESGISSESPIDYKPEERFFAEINSFIVSGQVDLQCFDKKRVELIDWKITNAAFAKLHLDKWEAQLNCYAYLFHQTYQTTPDALTIYAIYRDWSSWEAKRKPDSYPQQPLEKIGLRLWTTAQQKTFLEERINLHQDAWVGAEMAELPLCTDEDRWIESKWEVRAHWRKTPLKSFALKADAEDYASRLVEKGKLTIVEKKSEPRRCTGNWCRVAEFCSQYQSERKTNNVVELEGELNAGREELA